MPKVLDIRVDNLNWRDAREKVREFLRFGQHKIFTPNPEMVVKAQKDEYFKQVLNQGDLNLCDGFGLALVSGAKRIPGVDFMIELCKIAAEEGRGVFLLGSGADETVKKCAEELMKKFLNLKLVGFHKGPELRENFQFSNSPDASVGIPTLRRDNFQSGLIIDEIENDTVIRQINESGAEVLFVAFGMGKQEKWIAENLPKLPNIKIAMGVGGSFDYISGKIRRAPCWMRKIGLEWVYRLIRQPGRFWRILNATAGFLFLILKDKIKG